MTLDADAKKWLIKDYDRIVTFDEPMSRHTHIGVGGPAGAYIEPATQEDLLQIMQGVRNRGLPYMVIGGGSNLLVTDRGIDGVVVSLAACLSGISRGQMAGDDALIHVMAGARMQTLCRYAIDQGLSGMNFALGIPGTVGGGIMMNAGTSYGQISDVIRNIQVLTPDGDITTIPRDDIHFEYRSLTWPEAFNDKGKESIIILSGEFSLCASDTETLEREAKIILQERKEKQPVHLPSAGCIFKNPVSGKTAGELIDRAGFKGRRIGGAEVSNQHANFFINRGGASSDDFLTLIANVQEKVFLDFGVRLEKEVVIVGS